MTGKGKVAWPGSMTVLGKKTISVLPVLASPSLSTLTALPQVSFCMSWQHMTVGCLTYHFKSVVPENQDGGIGRHTAPPCTTRTERKSNGKEVRHQGNKKQTFIQTGRRGGDGQPGWKGLTLAWRDRDWPSVGPTGQAV